MRVGTPYFRSRLAIPIVALTVGLGLGWLYALNLIEDRLPQAIEFVFLAVPVVFTIVVVGVFAYRGEGVLFGWVLGTAVVFGPVTLMGYDMLAKERSMGQDVGITAFGELLVGSLLWSSLFALTMGGVGLVLGVGFRYLTS